MAFHPQTDGQTEVVNWMIEHILRMYNSKNPHTWDESLPYVQHSYNWSLHSSISHSLDSNHWVPSMLHLPLWSTRPTHSLHQLKLTKPPNSLNRSSTSTNKFRISYRSPMTSTNNAMINIRCRISFKWVTKFGCTCRKNALQDPIRSFTHSIMDYTLSPRPWGIILLSSTFLLSLACTQCSTWISFTLISHHYWTP